MVKLKDAMTYNKFKQNVKINVLQNSKLNIVCPNPASVLTEQDGSIPQEHMYENMWIVDKHEYDTCTVNTSAPSFSTNKKLLSCNDP
ncbi:Ephrin-B2a [Desmophyllum pertusum]|uniref:Ephrin-B2a n=1 Tax=Desmophyllum pertusum TaxID=174260 RepID=A0A9X0CIN4_9CNID|nr:Ephrin-B2a [Desmophyllum pertusum]